MNLCIDFNSDKTNIENWDYSFYARKLKEKLHNLDDEAIREYFPLEHVRREILSMYESLLGVEFRQFENAPNGWHETVTGKYFKAKERASRIWKNCS